MINPPVGFITPHRRSPERLDAGLGLGKDKGHLLGVKSFELAG
ncbi:hypothetical protein PYH37_000097 [Sinorhizobium numidicum]|uniref:Uncharacterized protein n=1 Tax=Sinorhizobium numidicum TaxID=680248 RepID=A0ABY8CWS7_9HYPH|nr:hypothetical protein [Sinorhizobium numidicum]WEX75807.1 hypothetical protein PYH37_000097 [Sinorhizobium numidicum]WEX81790.1 hypothetical protein PYH38_000099 [Sinorhizobium numidicum]